MNMNLLLLVVLVLLLVWMFVSSRRRNKKAKEEQERRKLLMVPGARVMTRTGLFGTIVEYDPEDLSAPAHIEIAPGVVVEVHSQSVDLANDAVADDQTDEAVDVVDDDDQADGTYNVNGTDVTELPGDDKPKN
ncbi:MAG: preprotein translocase subunit YajC [Microbacterium sp.]